MTNGKISVLLGTVGAVLLFGLGQLTAVSFWILFMAYIIGVFVQVAAEILRG